MPTKKASRKRRDGIAPVSQTQTPVETTTPAEPSLRDKLRLRLREKQLSRSSAFSIENRLEKLEDKLEADIPDSHRQKIKEELALLEKVRENQEDTNQPDYGGTTERAD